MPSYNFDRADTGLAASAFFFVLAVVMTAIEIHVILTVPSGDCPGTSGTSKVSVLVNTTTTPSTRLFNKNTFGNSILFESNASNMWDATNSVMYSGSWNAVQALAPNFIKFPSGPSANYFIWSQSIPGNQQPQYAYDGNTYTTYFGLVEFINMCQNLGSTPVWTYNVYNVSVQDLQALIAYTNGNISDVQDIGIDKFGVDWGNVSYWASQRGGPPFGLQYIELGYEVYDTTYPFAIEVDNYTSIVIEFVKAAKVIDPTVSIGISISNTMSDGWNDALFSGLASAAASLAPYKIDALALNYWNMYDQVPYLWLNYEEEQIFGYKADVQPFLVSLEQAIGTYGTTIPAELWVTAYNSQAVEYPFMNNFLDTFSLIDLMMSFEEWTSVNTSVGLYIKFGNVYDMGDSVYGVFDSQDYPGQPPFLRPSFYVLSTMAKMSSDLYAIPYTVTAGSFGSLTAAGVNSVEFYAFTNSSVLALVVENKACQAVTLNITLVGQSVYLQSKASLVYCLTGNLNSLSVVSVNGSTIDPTTVPTAFNGWNDYNWFDFGVLSYLNYEISLSSNYLILDVPGTSFTVAFIPLQPNS